MDRFLPLLVQVWQQACRHILLDESLAALLPLLAQRLPVTGMQVLRLEPERLAVTPLAEAPASAGGALHQPCTPVQWGALLDWCRSRAVWRGSGADLGRCFPALARDGTVGAVLAGGLNGQDGRAAPAGVLLLSSPREGAFEAAQEPLLAALLDPLAVALSNDQRLRELTVLREAAEADRRSMLARLGRQDIADTVIGAETGLREVLARVDLVARSDTPVLILGETGTGKEVVARAIHKGSLRAAAPFLRVNCGAIAPELIDSELFGHERGSFTGAVGLRKGWFERADRGTLFLDEVGDLSPSVQVRLLRILQDGTFQRVGGQQQLRVDVRIVAATHRDLFAMVQRGEFREDLWYRVAVFPIRLPALRERPEDIQAMAEHFAQRAAQRLGLPARVPSTEDLALLLGYPWPGNVRELASVMERAAILGNGRGLEVAAALGSGGPIPPPPVARADVGSPLATLDEAMRQHICDALLRCRGRIEGPFGAARLLDVNPHTLRARMRRLGIDWARYRRG